MQHKQIKKTLNPVIFRFEIIVFISSDRWIKRADERQSRQEDTKSSVRRDIAAEGWCERRREMVQYWRGEGGVFPPRRGKLRENWLLAAGACTLDSSQREERGWWWRSEERLLLSWCLWSREAFHPVSLSCCSSCSCVCVSVFFFFYILISVFVGRFIYCTPITITICNHVGLWGYDGVRQHRGADRAGRGESHPDDLRSFWQQRSVHHPRRRRQQQQSRPVRGWRGMLTNLDHCLLLYSNLF